MFPFIETMKMDYPSLHCPGLYCGRLRTNGSLSECSACPRGFRASPDSLCLPCKEDLMLYDWLYLGFMALLLLVLKWYVIDQTLKRRKMTVDVLLLHAAALVETILAGVLTLLLTHPIGTFEIETCGVRRLSDWYTLLYNPNPGYKTTLRCTQEAVYPLYSMVFLHFAFALVFLLVVRPLMITKFLRGKGKTSVYITMYIIPALSVVHATCGGLLYYAFPYISVIMSIFSMAAHFAFRLDQSMSSLFLTTVRDSRNLVILLGHWLLHAYGIVALTEMRDPVFHASLLALVPFPSIFYVITSKFTDPHKLHTD